MNSAELDPSKYHVLKANQKAKLIIIGILLLITGIPALGYGYYNFAVNRPSQTPNEKTIEIRGGDTISQIASLLYKEDVINSEFLFKVFIVLNNLENEIQAGVYVVPSGTNLIKLTEILQHGTNDKSITFLEGWRVEEFAKEASLKFSKIDYEDFIKEAKTYEGTLFPDTYIFSAEITEKELVNVLLETFSRKTETTLTEENLRKAGLTKEEALIFASMVEREVRTEEDRKLVAGILIKRWREGALLGVDATTQYVAARLRYGCDLESDAICPEEEVPEVNWWPNDLTQIELDIENPYNTRKLPGLPPTPICNPSLASIKAVLEFEQSDYYFYINDSEGTTHFAKTLEEHNANVAKYL